MKLVLITAALFAVFHVNTASASPPKCGKIISTLEGHWPWHVALFEQTPSEDGQRYICGGTLVSSRYVITAAHCVTKRGSKLDHGTLTVYLGKQNIKDFGEKIQVRAVKEILSHPKFNSTSLSYDLAILELRDNVMFSEWIQPACVWPDSDVKLQSIVGQTGLVAGWDYADKSGELKTLEMPVVSQETCIRSYPEFYARFTSSSTYCAGTRNSCLMGSSGMFIKKDGSWYLRGVSSILIKKQDVPSCDPQQYSIFADVAQFLPWIKLIVEDF